MRELIEFTLLHELIHFFVGAVLAVFVYRKFHKWQLVIIIFAVTFLIDLDHFFDYFYFLKFDDFRGPLFGVNYFSESQKVFVLFHSVEIMALFMIWGVFKKAPIFIAISLAMAGHILVDQLTYHPQITAYFVIFRILNNFSLVWFNG